MQAASALPTVASLPVAEAYESYGPQLRRYATARLRDAIAAEDVVQEAFYRLTVESQGWANPVNQRAWLYRVVTNLIISGARRTAVARRRSPLMDHDEAVFESPESVFLTSERDQGLRAALEVAGADARTGLILSAQGYSGREIAKIIGRSEGATRTLLCRARTTVRRELEGREATVAAG